MKFFNSEINLSKDDIISKPVKQEEKKEPIPLNNWTLVDTIKSLKDDLMIFLEIISHNIVLFYELKDIKLPYKDFFFNKKNLMNLLISLIMTD